MASEPLEFLAISTEIKIFSKKLLTFTVNGSKVGSSQQEDKVMKFNRFFMNSFYYYFYAKSNSYLCCS